MSISVYEQYERSGGAVRSFVKSPRVLVLNRDIRIPLQIFIDIIEDRTHIFVCTDYNWLLYNDTI